VTDRRKLDDYLASMRREYCQFRPRHKADATIQKTFSQEATMNSLASPNRARWAFGLTALMLAAVVAVLGFVQVSYSFNTGFSAVFTFKPADLAMDYEELAGRIGELCEEYHGYGDGGGSVSISISWPAEMDHVSISVSAASEVEALDLAEWLRERVPELSSAQMEITDVTQRIDISITDLLRMNISDEERSRILSERLSEKYGVPVEVEITTGESGGERRIEVKVCIEADTSANGAVDVTVGGE